MGKLFRFRPTAAGEMGKLLHYWAAAGKGRLCSRQSLLLVVVSMPYAGAACCSAMAAQIDGFLAARSFALASSHWRPEVVALERRLPAQASSFH